MKNSLLFLGIALVAFTNVSNAKNTVSESFSSFQKDFNSDDNEGIFPIKKPAIARPSLNEEIETFNPEIVIVHNGKTSDETIAEGDKIIKNTISDDMEFMAYEASVKEIIAQADLVIENSVSNETFPLFYDRTVADEIAELEMIIESKETNEILPLDFKKINSDATMTNSFNYKRYVGIK
jgi:hypothetical protein